MILYNIMGSRDPVSEEGETKLGDLQYRPASIQYDWEYLSLFNCIASGRNNRVTQQFH